MGKGRFPGDHSESAPRLVGSERRAKWVAFVGEVAMKIRSSSIENEDPYHDVVGRHGGGEEVSRGGANN